MINDTTIFNLRFLKIETVSFQTMSSGYSASMLAAISGHSLIVMRFIHSLFEKVWVSVRQCPGLRAIGEHQSDLNKSTNKS